MEKKNTSMFSCTDDMKRSPSQLALEELLKHTSVQDFNNCNQKDDHKVFGGNNGDTNGAFGFENGGRRFDDHVSYPIRNQDMTNGFPSCGAATDKALWSQNLTPKNSSITVTIDSQSSICVGSPTSATKPKSRDNNQATSGSSHNPSDDDDIETEAGPCEQSTDPSHPTDIKRIKRMVSNRESARRSRRRKQAHLADLEQQVEQLRGENASLFKQLADATQQFKDATTNNRVLKSDVEALRAKVKLAEDLVTRGTLTSNLSHLLQNYLNTPQSTNNNNMSPTIAVRGDDNTFPGVSLSGQGSAFGLENIDSFIGSIKNGGVISDSVSCVSDIWPWESHVAPVSK